LTADFNAKGLNQPNKTTVLIGVSGFSNTANTKKTQKIRAIAWRSLGSLKLIRRSKV
jgi:hypothetical protein